MSLMTTSDANVSTVINEYDIFNIILRTQRYWWQPHSDIIISLFSAPVAPFSPLCYVCCPLFHSKP